MVSFPDKNIIDKRINRFVDNAKKRRKNIKKTSDISIADRLNQAPCITDEMIKNIFENEIYYTVPKQVVADVQKVLKGMQKKINLLPPDERLSILETIDLFNQKIGLGKLIPAILILKGENQKKAICKLVFPTFLSINRNVEILASDNRLFTSQNVHLERGALYSFRNDISKILMGLFYKEFVEKNNTVFSPTDFLQNAFVPGTFRINATIKSPHKYIFSEMIHNESALRRVVLRFIVAVQSHETLITYCRKRHLYYKLFLADLTSKNRFDNVEPFDISRILLACMLLNRQLSPDTALMEAMLDSKKFNARSTERTRNEFLDEHSPKQIYSLINRFKNSVQHIYQVDFEKSFYPVQSFALKNTFIRIWESIVKVIETSLSVMIEIAQPSIKIFQQIRNTYDALIRDEKKETAETKSNISGRKTKHKAITHYFNSKNVESFTILRKHFILVKTSVIELNNEKNGASLAEFQNNSILFKKNETLMKCFLACFRRFFKSLPYNENVIVIEDEKQPAVKEYRTSYVFGNYLICLGITHQSMIKAKSIDEKNLFPYVLLFAGGKRNDKGGVKSREAVFNKKKKLFYQLDFNKKNIARAYESLYLILHLLPEKDWGQKSTQICIQFLVKELQKYKQSKNKLLYCSTIPAAIT